jgi:hypothetical protein
MIGALTIILLLGLPVCGPRALQEPRQSRPVAAADDRSASTTRTLSPYLIEWIIDINENVDLASIWRLLGIDVPGDASRRCGGNCSAETFDIENSERSKTVALKVSFEGGEQYRYLFFKKAQGSPTEETWKFIGKLDARGERYYPPTHRIESGDGRTWFVTREVLKRGPAAHFSREVWHELKEMELKPVLSYAVEGRDLPCQGLLGRSYKSLLLRHGLENGVYTIPLQLLVSYNIPNCARADDSRPLFAKGHKAYYLWDDKAGRFVLDTSRSDVAEAEINSVYTSEGLSHEKFVEYNFAELLSLARGRETEQKSWLRRFVIGIKESSRKTALLSALEQ